MPGLAPDHNIEGHFRILLRLFESPTWKGLWTDLKVTAETFQTLGLLPEASDREVWHRCQERGVILVTGNRNHDGPDSLEATIRSAGTPTSLPIITIANLDRLLESKAYAEKVAEEILWKLVALDDYRGTGRLYVP